MRLGHALEEPDVADRRGQVDVAHALAANLRARDLDAAALAHDALVADALVLAAVALPVLGGTEDALAEEAVLLRLQRAVVDRLRLGHLAGAPAADLLGGGEADLDRVEVVDVDHLVLLSLAFDVNSVALLESRRATRPARRTRPSRSSSCRRIDVDQRVHADRARRRPRPTSASAVRCLLRVARRPRRLGRVLAVEALVAGVAGERTHAREVDAELLGGAQQVVVLVAHLRALALLGDDVDVERQRLHLLEQHLEGLRDRRLGDVLALDDRLVGLHAPDRVVGLDREHLLQRVGGAEGLERPHLHLAEALAAELRLAAQRLLGDERVRTGRARVDLVVDEVQQLQDVHVADGDLFLERLAGAAVEQRHLARGLLARAAGLVDVHADAPLCASCHLTSALSTSATVAPSNTGVATYTRPSPPSAWAACRRPSRRRTSPARRPSRGASRGSGRRSCATARRAG